MIVLRPSRETAKNTGIRTSQLLTKPQYHVFRVRIEHMRMITWICRYILLVSFCNVMIGVVLCCGWMKAGCGCSWPRRNPASMICFAEAHLGKRCWVWEVFRILKGLLVWLRKCGLECVLTCTRLSINNRVNHGSVTWEPIRNCHTDISGCSTIAHNQISRWQRLLAAKAGLTRAIVHKFAW